MKKLFEITGVLICISAVITLFFVFTEAFNLSGGYIILVAISCFFTFVLGLAFYSIAGLLNRVSYLEKKLKLSVVKDPDYLKTKEKKEPAIKGSDFRMTHKTCPKCEDSHDFDFPKCPACGYKYELDLEE